MEIRTNSSKYSFILPDLPADWVPTRITEFDKFGFPLLTLLYLRSDIFRKKMADKDFVLVEDRLLPVNSPLIVEVNGKYKLSKPSNEITRDECVVVRLGHEYSYERRSAMYASMGDLHVVNVRAPLSDNEKSRMIAYVNAPKTMPIFPECLKDILKNKNVTQEQLAEKIEVSDRTIRSMIENPDYHTPLRTIVALCVALDLGPY